MFMINLQIDEEILKEMYNQKIDEYLQAVEHESMFLTFSGLVKYLNISNVSIREFLLWREDFPKIRLGSKVFPRKEVSDYMEEYLKEVKVAGGDMHAMKRHKKSAIV